MLSCTEMHTQCVLNVPWYLWSELHVCVQTHCGTLAHTSIEARTTCSARQAYAQTYRSTYIFQARCTCVFSPEHVYTLAQSYRGICIYMSSDSKIPHPCSAHRCTRAQTSGSYTHAHLQLLTCFRITGTHMHVQNSYIHSVLRPAKVQVHTCTDMKEFREVHISAQAHRNVCIPVPPKYTLMLRPAVTCTYIHIHQDACPQRYVLQCQHVCLFPQR